MMRPFEMQQVEWDLFYLLSYPLARKEGNADGASVSESHCPPPDKFGDYS
jgi:hypothetical protein